MHRELGFSLPPKGAGFPPSWEWRKDAPLPLRTHLSTQAWIQYYLDDFDAPEIFTTRDALELMHTVSENVARQRDAYQHVGVSTSVGKSNSKVDVVERMGGR